ncbi:hypothetical protein C2G38_2226864 [Gigaspora rosea]|uniref:Uncharacterized protein n=1 Tax=Gigaspora rosea TaxID=44941 RepID=A0A397U0T8_9GLOM|nr:hypothetical protein C2G38_2226864 [Gigaspora rosea]
MCTALFEVLTEKQAIEAQEVINKAFGNCKVDDDQIPQLLEFIKKKLPWIDFSEILLPMRSPCMKVGPILREVRNKISVKKDEDRVERAETENYVKTKVRKVNASGSTDKTNTVGPCCEKGIGDEKDEIIEAERKEESRIKKNEKDDDDYETIVDEEDSEKEKDENNFKKTKEPNRKEHADIEDTTGTSEGRKNGIGSLQDEK